MSIIGFLLKSKKKMAKEDTEHVKVGKYTITPHAQNRIVDKKRRIDKCDVLDNLFTKRMVFQRLNTKKENPLIIGLGNEQLQALIQQTIKLYLAGVLASRIDVILI